MDIRLVAYKSNIIGSGIRTNDTIVTNDNGNVINVIELNATDFPVGTDPTDYFSIGQKVYNPQSLLVGTITVIDSALPLYHLQ